MKQDLTHYPFKFHQEITSPVHCIFFDPINADIYISFEIFVRFAVVKGDDISIGVVVEVFHVEAVKILIVAENEVQVLDPKSFSLCDMMKPPFNFQFFRQVKFKFFLKEINGHWEINSCKKDRKSVV